MINEHINIAIADASGLLWVDYCNDLNAMHEAEEWLINSGLHRWVAYTEQLGWIGVSPDRKIIHATARQRAEAFLKTLRKREE